MKNKYDKLLNILANEYVNIFPHKYNNFTLNTVPIHINPGIFSLISQVESDNHLHFIFFSEYEISNTLNPIIIPLLKEQLLSAVYNNDSYVIIVKNMFDIMSNIFGNDFSAAFVILDEHINSMEIFSKNFFSPILYQKNNNKFKRIKNKISELTIRDKKILTCSYYAKIFPKNKDKLILLSQNCHNFLKSSLRDNENYYNKLSAVLNAKQKRGKNSMETILDGDTKILEITVTDNSLYDKVKIELGFSIDDNVYIQTLRYYEEIENSVSVILKDMDNAGFNDETIRKTKLAVTELIANAIEHGNKMDYTKKVTIGHKIDSKKIAISILDEGSGFDPSKIPDPTLPENILKDHGRGLYIVKNYIDDINFNNKGNRVTICKYRHNKK